MTNADVLSSLRLRLPRHGALIDAMTRVVAGDERWRSLEVSCSLGAGGGDELSDIDAGLGYDGIAVDDLFAAAAEFAVQIGDPVDFTVHRMDGWPPTLCRLAAEYPGGLQLDLVLIPLDRRPGLPERSFVTIDKDGHLAEVYVPQARHPPTVEVARQWVVLGWWAIATADKYVRRGALFEAVHSIDEARMHALRLWATGGHVPYPCFGLTSLLDFPPFELPDDLAATYAAPRDQGEVAVANRATADLLVIASERAGVALGSDIASPLAATVRDRLV